MKPHLILLLTTILSHCSVLAAAQHPSAPRQPDGDATVAISGELKQWHNVTLTLDGPFAHERDTQPNAFTDLAFNVTFTHESGAPSYTVPGYFAADGSAANSSAEAGTKWRAHLSPDKPGSWTYRVSFTKGRNAALDGGGEVLKPFDAVSGRFTISKTDKTGRDFRAGVWQPAPWWLEIGADAAVSRLQLHLKREEGGIGPLPSAFRHVYASLVRWIYRCALPSGRMAEFPHGVFQPRIPLLHSVAMPIAESIANEIKEYIRSQSPAFIRRLEALPPARPGSEQEYWSEELDRLRKWATQTSGFEPNAVRHDASPHNR